MRGSNGARCDARSRCVGRGHTTTRDGVCRFQARSTGRRVALRHEGLPHRPLPGRGLCAKSGSARSPCDRPNPGCDATSAYADAGASAALRAAALSDWQSRIETAANRRLPRCVSGGGGIRTLGRRCRRQRFSRSSRWSPKTVTPDRSVPHRATAFTRNGAVARSGRRSVNEVTYRPRSVEASSHGCH